MCESPTTRFWDNLHWKRAAPPTTRSGACEAIEIPFPSSTDMRVKANPARGSSVLPRGGGSVSPASRGRNVGSSHLPAARAAREHVLLNAGGGNQLRCEPYHQLQPCEQAFPRDAFAHPERGEPGHPGLRRAREARSDLGRLALAIRDHIGL